MLPTNIAEHLLQRWPFGEVLCKLVLAIDHCNIFSSVYFLAAMSIDPATWWFWPQHAPAVHALRTVRRAKVASLCASGWVTVTVLPFLTFAGVQQ